MFPGSQIFHDVSGALAQVLRCVEFRNRAPGRVGVHRGSLHLLTPGKYLRRNKS